PFELETNNVPMVCPSCNTTSTARECVVDSTIVYAFSRNMADDAWGNCAFCGLLRNARIDIETCAGTLNCFQCLPRSSVT
ncbi:hypothetical protein PM082_000474, partial [Marasmius tenuissimus]